MYIQLIQNVGSTKLDEKKKKSDDPVEDIGIWMIHS